MKSSSDVSNSGSNKNVVIEESLRDKNLLKNKHVKRNWNESVRKIRVRRYKEKQWEYYTNINFNPLYKTILIAYNICFVWYIKMIYNIPP